MASVISLLLLDFTNYQGGSVPKHIQIVQLTVVAPKVWTSGVAQSTKQCALVGVQERICRGHDALSNDVLLV